MFCVLLSSHSFHARIYKTPLQLQFNHLSCLLKGKFCICYCEHFISWATENKLSCSEYTRRSQTGRLYIDSENQRLRYCWCHFCCFSVKTCVHLGLTLFKVSSAASFSISKCLNINFGCLLAKCSPSQLFHIPNARYPVVWFVFICSWCSVRKHGFIILSLLNAYFHSFQTDLNYG